MLVTQNLASLTMSASCGVQKKVACGSSWTYACTSDFGKSLITNVEKSLLIFLNVGFITSYTYICGHPFNI